MSTATTTAEVTAVTVDVTEAEAADVVVESNGADEVPIKKNEMDAGKSSRPVLAHQDKKKGKQKKKRLQPNGTSKDGFARGNSGT